MCPPPVISIFVSSSAAGCAFLKFHIFGQIFDSAIQQPYHGTTDDHSPRFQVFASIQTQVMTEDPYYNQGERCRGGIQIRFVDFR